MKYITESLNNDISNKIIEFDKLRFEIHSYIENITKNQPNLTNDDLRIYYFIQIDNILLDVSIAYELSKNLNIKQWWVENYPICKNDDIQKRIELFHKSIALNLINLAFSITEDIFRQLIRQIKPNACNNGKAAFGSIYPCLLRELNISYDDSLFKLFRLTRNCFHNNGFYYPENNTKSEEVVYKNIKYSFPYGQKVVYPETGGLPIIEIIYDLTTLYFTMVESEKLRTKHTIKKA